MMREEKKSNKYIKTRENSKWNENRNKRGNKKEVLINTQEIRA